MAGLVDETGLVDEMKPTSNLCGPKDSLSHIHDKSRDQCGSSQIRGVRDLIGVELTRASRSGFSASP